MLRSFVVFLATAALGIATARQASAETARNGSDVRDLQRLASKHPEVPEMIERGEGLAMAGSLTDALEAFQQAAREAPESALAARRECQTLTLLERRSEALPACVRAARNGGSPMDLRALVAALVSGRDAPTTGDLAQAMRMARRARETMPQEPWGYAAECDIALRIGDAQMLDQCLSELERVAPDHYETARAFSLTAPLRATFRVWAAWLAVFILALGTLAHVLWRALRVSAKSPRAGASVAMVLAFMAALSVAKSGRAQDNPENSDVPPELQAHPGMLSDWPVDDKDPESSVPTDQKKERNPLQFGYWLMDLAWKGQNATKHGDHQAAIQFYKAMIKAVPDRSVSYTRLCESYEAAGDWKSAMETCATALTHGGTTTKDYAHYFALALAKKGPLTREDVDVLAGVIQHLRGDDGGRELAVDLDCQLAVRIEDLARLQECTQALVARAPDDPKTISYQWALALKRSNFQEAEDLLERARSTDMEPAGIEQMVRGMESVRAGRRRKIYIWSFAGLAVLGLAGTAMIWMTRRRRLLRSA
jgi:tetratricopeptide (TPR) repeat protein